jgi:hypothetical protein
MNPENIFFNSNTEDKLEWFKHYPLKLARKEHSAAMKRMVQVTTINWTYANNDPTQIDFDPSKPSPNFKEVHKNQYLFTFEELIDFIRITDYVAEDVIEIEFVES